MGMLFGDGIPICFPPDACFCELFYTLLWRLEWICCIILMGTLSAMNKCWVVLNQVLWELYFWSFPLHLGDFEGCCAGNSWSWVSVWNLCGLGRAGGRAFLRLHSQKWWKMKLGLWEKRAFLGLLGCLGGQTGKGLTSSCVCRCCLLVTAGLLWIRPTCCDQHLAVLTAVPTQQSHAALCGSCSCLS